MTQAMLKLIYYLLKNYFRDFESIFWTLVLPLIFLILFKFVSLGNTVGVNVLIVDEAQDVFSESVINHLNLSENININTQFDNKDSAINALQEKKSLKFSNANDSSTSKAPNLILLLNKDVTNQVEIVFDPAEEGQVSPSDELEKEVLKLFSNSFIQVQKEGITDKEINFYDIFVPGILAFSIAQAQTTSLAIMIATQKEKRIFKRIAATPLSVPKYLFAQIGMHLIIGLFQTTLVLFISQFVLNANIYGNLLYIYSIVVLGNILFLNLGFISGSLTKTAKAANGIASAIVLPMLFLSGVFVQRSQLPNWLYPISNYMPLTPIVDALRGISLYEKSIADFQTEILIVLVWIFVSMLVAVKVFKFRED